MSKKEDVSLLGFMQENSEFVSENEEEEFKKMCLDLDNLLGEEVSLDELLEDQTS